MPDILDSASLSKERCVVCLLATQVWLMGKGLGTRLAKCNGYAIDKKKRQNPSQYNAWRVILESMAKSIHILSQIDGDKRTAICANCGPVSIDRSSSNRSGWRCQLGKRKFTRSVDALEKRRESNRKRRRPYKEHKRTTCELCAFTGHPCQLDVHHLDGNHRNNDPTNLQTLCANCHRLVTWNEKHFSVEDA